jgi:hypothetical protein
MKPGTTTHPKFRALMRSLGLPQYVIVGLLESVWTLAAQFADDGNLSRFDAHAIADYSGYEGDAEALLDALVDCGWLDRIDGKLCIHDWDDHCPDYIYDRRRKRQKRAELRTSLKQSGNVPDNPGKSPPIKSNPIQSSDRGQRFVPPTIEEVKTYCDERKNQIDAAQFVNHYTANGWVRGKTKVRDWKAAIRYWEGNATTAASGGSSSAESDRPELKSLDVPRNRKGTK